MDIAEGWTAKRAAVKLPPMLLALALAASVSLPSPQTVAEWKAEENPRTRETNDTYVMGLGEGMMRAGIGGAGRTPVLCPPHQLPMTGSMMLNIFKQFIEDKPTMDKFSVGGVMFQALKETFPCEAPHKAK